MNTQQNRHLSSFESWEKVARKAKFHPVAMAGVCTNSLRQLERFFVEHFNVSPKTWTRELRCQLARELIAQGWTSKAVAAELHFANDSHLCGEFKRLYGVPPRTFAPTFRQHENVAFLQ